MARCDRIVAGSDHFQGVAGHPGVGLKGLPGKRYRLILVANLFAEGSALSCSGRIWLAHRSHEISEIYGMMAH